MMEIKSEDSQSDGGEDYYYEDTFDTVNCHICNVKVPVLCLERHNESEKHVTLKTIFQKVLERVSKQINMIVINNDEVLDKDVYFCVPCSKIIRIENQPKHEASEYHVKSQRSIDVVHEFYKIFQENKGYVGVKEIGKEEILDEKRDLSQRCIDVSNEDKTKIVCPANDHTNTIKPSCTVQHLVRNEKHNEELISEEKYFKDMVKKYNLKVNLPIVDGDFIKVASPSGVKVKIPRDHFHSYQSIVEGNRVHCQMCTTWSELGQESKHKVTEEHVRNIFLPVNEKFVRTLNDYSIHCLICNKVTRILSIHICQNNEDLANSINTENIGQTHSDNKRNKCINNKEYISKHDLSENHLRGLIFCELCNVNVPQNLIEYHNAGTPHWCNAFKNICKNVPDGLQAYFSNDSFKTDSDLSGKQNYIPKNDNITKQNDISGNDDVVKQNDISENDNLTKENDILKNDNVTKQNDIPKNDNVTKQNIISENDNVTKQNNILKNDSATKQNNISENDNATKEYNIPKNDNVSKQNNISENDNVTKQNNILKNDSATKQNNISENDNATKEYNIPKNDNVSKQNNISENDNVTKQNNILKNDSATKQNNISENDNATKEYNIPKNDNVSKQNNISENDNVTKQNDIPKNYNLAKQNDIPKNDNAASSTVSNIANYVYIIDLSRPFRFADSTKNNVTCIVCDIDIPTNDSRIITKHEESSDHTECVRNLFKFHTVKYGYFNRMYCHFCESCGISFPIGSNNWAHIGTERHIALLQNNFEIDPEALKFYALRNKVRNAQGIMYRELYKMLLKYNQIYKSFDRFYYCSFCQREFTVASGEVIDHMFTAEHEKLLKIILSSIFPRKKGDSKRT